MTPRQFFWQTMLCIRVVCHEGEGRDWPAVRTSLRDDEKAHIEAGEDSGECVKIGDSTGGAVRRCRSNHAQSPCFLPTSVMPPGRSQGNCFRISERPPTASCSQLCQDEACGTSPTREIVVSSVLKDHPERWQMPISIRRARASTETLAHSSSQAFQFPPSPSSTNTSRTEPSARWTVSKIYSTWTR